MSEAIRIKRKLEALHARIDNGEEVSVIEWRNVESLWSLYIERELEKGRLF